MGVAVGPFRPTRVGFEGGENVVRNQLAVLGQGARAGFHALPLDGHAGGIHRAHRGFGNFGSDPVAGNQRDVMGHKEKEKAVSDQPSTRG